MTTLPAAFRAKLVGAGVRVGDLREVKTQTSKDGTVKQALALHDGMVIETVVMPYRDGRRTACVSSQCGCAQGCVFCATGQMGFGRQLTASEIFEQVALSSARLRQKGERLSHVVMMGMGEPLANYHPVMEAVRRMHDELQISYRRITISTVGLVPRIERLAKEGLPVTLAVSLHQSDDAQRSELMPINKRFPIHQVLAACLHYFEATSRRVSFQWALIEGENDSPATAHRLGKLLVDAGLKGKCHVNVIPLNATQGYDRQASHHVAKFCEALQGFGVPCTARRRKGIDIEAGCGQLAAELTRSV